MIAAPSRTTRRDPGASRPTPRDLLGLAAIATFQPMSSSAYLRYLGLHYDIARRSLNKLRDLGLVHVFVTGMEFPRLYTLTPGGARAVARFTGQDVEDVHLLRDVPDTGLDHHALTVDVLVALTVAAAGSRRLALEDVLLDRDIRRRLGNPRDALVPDAVAVMCGKSDVGAVNTASKGKCGTPDHVDGDAILMNCAKSDVPVSNMYSPPRFAFAIEADLGTENPSYVVTHKALPYAAWKTAGHSLCGCADWVVLVVVPTLRRLHRLTSAACEAGVPDGLLFFALANEVRGDTVLTPIWRTFRMGEDGQVRLTTESPFAAARSGCSDGSSRPTGTIGSAGTRSALATDVADSGSRGRV